jgi:hypothetical protein
MPKDNWHMKTVWGCEVEQSYLQRWSYVKSKRSAMCDAKHVRMREIISNQ